MLDEMIVALNRSIEGFIRPVCCIYLIYFHLLIIYF